MKFLDTNILVYALTDPGANPQDRQITANALGIMHRLLKGERALCSVVHVSEFANIMRRKQGVAAAIEAVASLLAIRRLVIAAVDIQHYRLAVQLARESGVSLNDCLAVAIMNEHDVAEIYSYDTDFDRLSVGRATE